MFGADTPLVMDALQMVAIALVVGAAGMWAIQRRRKSADSGEPPVERSKHDLEERVRVLERIATDRSTDLADEIEALRDEKETA